MKKVITKVAPLLLALSVSSSAFALNTQCKATLSLDPAIWGAKANEQWAAFFISYPDGTPSNLVVYRGGESPVMQATFPCQQNSYLEIQVIKVGNVTSPKQLQANNANSFTYWTQCFTWLPEFQAKKDDPTTIAFPVLKDWSHSDKNTRQDAYYRYGTAPALCPMPSTSSS